MTLATEQLRMAENAWSFILIKSIEAIALVRAGDYNLYLLFLL